jgi:hypothetical protein
MMAIRDKSSIDAYVAAHARILAMLDNLKEFAESMPAPREDGILPFDYEYHGSTLLVADLLGQVAEHVDSMCS